MTSTKSLRTQSLLALLAMLIALACTWPLLRTRLARHQSYAQLDVQLERIEKLSSISLANQALPATNGIPFDPRTPSKVTATMLGWYKITQQRIPLAKEISFLRERAEALLDFKSAVDRLPESESHPFEQAFLRCKAAWQACVPKEMTDDLNGDWSKIAESVNAALISFAREVRVSLPP